MTDENMRKKIAIAAAHSYDDWVEEDYAKRIQKIDFDKLADALIAAGIGDVSELKKHRVVVEKSLIPEDDNAYVLPNIPPTVKQLYSGEEVEQIVKEREEYKHRTEVAERAVENLSYKRAKILLYDDSETAMEKIKQAELSQAEKELAEERKE